MMRKPLSNVIFLLLILVLVFPIIPPAPVQAASGSDMVAAVNALRRSKGLADLQVNSSLMSAAQGHSDYQAALGTWTHTGPGGSTPTGRAAAAGFGSGTTVFVSENVAYTSSTAGLDYIIYTVWSDALHWNTMINPNYTHAGAGVTVKGGYTYFTLDVGYIAGKAGSASQASAIPTQIKTTQVPVAPMIKSTPLADGSIYHPVMNGQTLLTISQTYGLTVDELKKLNNLTDTLIFIGQKLLIQRASTPTVSPTITHTALPPTRTATPTAATRTPTMIPSPTTTSTATPQPFLPNFENVDRQSLGIAIIAICGLGLALVVISLFRKKA